jgi:hypothetical protein
MAPIMIVVSSLTPRLTGYFGANRTVAVGMCGVALGLTLLRALDTQTSYDYVLLAFVPLVGGMALSMSPMTASIMSAVPSRRAGAGSAMNDATRELGAALGIALMGSVAASRYATSVDDLTARLPVGTQVATRTSLADAISAAAKLPNATGQALRLGAEHAFIDGIHLAVTTGAGLALAASLIVLRYLPRHIAPETSMHGAMEAMEDTAELGLAGVLPAFADSPSGPREA